MPTMIDDALLCSESGSSRRRKSSKVRSGCRTCKTRKVKCDEGWPACRRCVSVGRTCDGYGIWGGGGQVCHSARRSIDATAQASIQYSAELDARASYQTARVRICLSGIITPDEHQCLEWFFHRTWAKLPGVFTPGFWSTLIAQAIHDEPAVLHAVVALSSVHRANFYNSDSETTSLRDLRRLALLNYSKSIHHLRLHFSTATWPSTRVVLITCLVFVFLEYLEGHYKMGHIHFNNGLNLLQGRMKHQTSLKNSPLSTSCVDTVDKWILEIFFRLYVQLRDFPIESQVLSSHCVTFPWTLGDGTFHSIDEARNELDQALMRIADVITELRRLGTGPYDGYRQRQQRIQGDLASWFERCEATRADPHRVLGIRDKFAYQTLLVHYAMARIACACALSLDESLYDEYTEDFISILKQSLDVRAIVQTPKILKQMLNIEHGPNFSNHSSDRGWIAPLYFTALKCRVQRIRLQAIQLISSSSHKEGMWDSQLVARIAGKVVQIEESTVPSRTTENSFEITSCPNFANLSPPIIPYENRIHDVQFGCLNMDDSEQLSMICTRRQKDGKWSSILSEYDPALQVWTDRW